MADIHLSPDEKASLTSFARKLVERSSRAPAQRKEGEASVDMPDQFSGDGLLRRILSLEEKLERSNRAWKTTVDAILVTVERLETKVERAGGEMVAFREIVERMQFASSVDREELMAAVEGVIAKSAADMVDMVGRLEKALAASLPSSVSRQRD